MKKIIILSFIALFLLTPVLVYGQQSPLSPPCTNAPSSTLCNPIRFSSDNLMVFAFRIVTIFTIFFPLMAVVYVVYSGFRMAISQGDEESLTLAKNAFTWSLYGLILGMFAFVIIYATGEFIGARDIDPNSYVGNNPAQNPLGSNVFGDFLIRLLTQFLSIASIIVLLMVIIGGFRYITARGDDEQLTKAKSTLKWAIIGLIVISLSYVLVRATLTFFGN